MFSTQNSKGSFGCREGKRREKEIKERVCKEKVKIEFILLFRLCIHGAKKN